MKQGRWLAIGFVLAGLSTAALGRISDEDRAAAAAFQASVRGEREFSTDFMIEPPSGDERAYLMNLGSCSSGGLREGRDGSVRITWSCNTGGQRFQKEVILQMEGGKIAKVGVFDCVNIEGRRRCQ